jgi:hypothetical protein
MSTEAVCPHCRSPLYDLDLDRCTTCGRQLPLERASAAPRNPGEEHPQSTPPRRPIARTASTAKTPESAAEAPMAPVVATPTRLPALGSPVAEHARTALYELYLRILVHSAVGLALWSILIIPLGRLGGVPYTTLPAVLAGVACLVAAAEYPSRWHAITGATAMAALVIACIWF